MEEVREEYEQVSKKQKTYVSHLKSEVDNLIQSIETCKLRIEEGSEIPKEGLANIQKQIHENYKKVQSAHKDFHSQVSKFGKCIDKTFCADQEKAYREGWDAPQHILNLIIAEHLYREGNFNLGQIVEKETNVHVTDEYKQSFMEMYGILSEMKKRNLKPALTWCEQRRDALLKKQSNLEFQLHKLQFIQLITGNNHHNGNSRIHEAIAYARKNFGQFSQQNMKEINHLMGSLLYASKLSASPYRDMLNEDLWEEIMKDFKKECCSLSNMPVESPLFVTVTAGSKALPTILKLVSITQTKKSLIDSLKYSTDQLGVEIDLGPEFTFHSIFACPVSKEQATPTNPPMILPCGHVLLKESIQRIIRGHRFKCPYCPQEATFSECKTINF